MEKNIPIFFSKLKSKDIISLQSDFTIILPHNQSYYFIVIGGICDLFPYCIKFVYIEYFVLSCRYRLLWFNIKFELKQDYTFLPMKSLIND